jgi:hypothetical protein
MPWDIMDAGCGGIFSIVFMGKITGITKGFFIHFNLQYGILGTGLNEVRSVLLL